MQENHGVFHAIDSPYGQHKTARLVIPVVVAVSDDDLCLSPLATTHIGASIGHLLNLLSMLFYLSFFYCITSSWFFKTLSKWNERNQSVIYSSDAQLYRATWDNNSWELSDIQAISPAHIIVDFYDWAREWQDIIFTDADSLGIISQLWRYRNEELEAIDLGQPIRALSVMSAPDSNAIVVTLPIQDYIGIYQYDSVQRIRLTATSYSLDTLIVPEINHVGYYFPHLSPNGDKIYYFDCGWAVCVK